MVYVIDPPARANIAVGGTADRFPVRRVYCVGRNYAAHAREMGHDPDREPPFFFTKPADALVPDGSVLAYPMATDELHHEIELVVALATGGRRIVEADALDRVYGYAVGLDMPRRDLQGQAKDLGRPWDTGKAFDGSAPIGALVPACEIGHRERGRIWLDVNGETRQDGDLAQMIWRVPETIAYLSGLFELAPGDLIFTGTPAGVGPVGPGDTLAGGIEGIGTLSIRYTDPA